MPCLQQQAYLSTCLDDTLRARIDQEATATTPIYSPVAGLWTYIKILDSAFLEICPLHIRRKQFFEAQQKEGQSPLKFCEELLSLINEEDGTNITVNDLLCMMLQIGSSDQGLQRELGSIREPTLQSFTEKIEGYEHGLKSMGTSVFANAATKGPAPRRSKPQNSRNNPSNPNRGKGERSRRIALHGKSFRCAKGDHMIPNCTYPETVKCNTCGMQGHIAPACSRRQNAQATSSSTSLALNASSQLAIAYDGGSNFPSDGESSAWQLPSSLLRSQIPI